MKELTVAVIAGGKSTRFGSPKCQVMLSGKTLLDRAVELAYRIAPRVMVISGEQPITIFPQTPVYPDVFPGLGPLGGIYTALLHTPTPYLATLPCDAPLLNERIFEYLSRYTETDRPIVAVSHKGMEPLVALWPKSALPTIRRFLDARQLSLRRPLQHLQAVEVYLPVEMPEYHPFLFHNINTQEDLRTLLVYLERQKIHEEL